MKGSHSIRPRLHMWQAPELVPICVVVLAAAVVAGCIPSPSGTQTVAAPAPPTETPGPRPSPEPTSPPITGPDPSPQVAAFYYPWYGNLDANGEWVHWQGLVFSPPLDISSDYFPSLGAYSATDPAVVAQHFAWLREAEVGVIVTSWWGQGSFEDRAVPALLEQGARYGIGVAFHIEPYPGRSATQLVDDIQYIYDRYGDHQGFFRTTASSRWSPDNRPKGLFFLFAPAAQAPVGSADRQPVDASYWAEALDAVHALPDGGLVIASTVPGSWVDGGHFDGLYNYVTLHLDQQGGFSWAQSLPRDAWYVPSVIPGNSARRIGYSEDLYVPRLDGATYDEQWQAALGAGIEPEMVTITSFNEWHEGTQIEPAAAGATNGLGYTYDDYDPLPPEAYLGLTRGWVDHFLSMTWPATYRTQVRISTTSGWTTFRLVDGARWVRPEVVSASEGEVSVGVTGNAISLNQPLAQAEAGTTVEAVIDVLLTDVQEGNTLVFAIERGHLGYTQVDLANYSGTEPVVIETLQWAGINPDERNTLMVEVPAAGLLNPLP